jgi:hypothetical protein
VEKMANYGGKIDNLAECDRFFIEIRDIPSLVERLKAWKFRVTFKKVTTKLLEDINLVNQAAKELSECESFLKFLEIVCAVTSFLNSVHHTSGDEQQVSLQQRMEFKGFKLKSLLKLADTKSCDNKLTLLDYIVQFIGERHVHLLDIAAEMKSVQGTAANVSVKDLNDEFRSLKKQLKFCELQMQVQREANIPGDQFQEQMSKDDFLEQLAPKVFQEIDDRMKWMQQQLISLGKLFHETELTMKNNPDEFFGNVRQFLLLFEQKVNNWRQEQQQLLRHQVESSSTTGSGNSSVEIKTYVGRTSSRKRNVNR